jgi:hypothetical protein
MSNTKHTPGPWIAVNEAIRAEVKPRMHQTIAQTLLVNYADRGEHLANAAFIVTACNAHDDLLEALQAARPFIMEAYRDHGHESANVVLCLIADALAKVQS